MNTDPDEKTCTVCGCPEPCSHDFDKMEWPKTPEGACPDCGGEGFTIGFADTGLTQDQCASCRGTGEAQP